MKARLARAATFFVLLLAPVFRSGAQQRRPVSSDSLPRAVPFAFADFTWLNGTSRQSVAVLDTKAFTGEFRADVSYIAQFHHPKDHALVGTSESGRTSEVQLQQLGVGGDFHFAHARGRLMTQFGLYSTMTPRNDASPGRGQWDLGNAYRYLSEAYGGYHWDALHGINLDAGIFMSYVGLFSYYNFDNWAYQPSYVSSNTPWFFNGLRIQIFPTDRVKIEPWIVNGWQSYGMFNSSPGLGVQVLYRPSGVLSLLSNEYWGRDWLGTPGRLRLHSDNSIQVEYRHVPRSGFSRGALSIRRQHGRAWLGRPELDARPAPRRDAIVVCVACQVLTLRGGRRPARRAVRARR